MSEIKSEKRIDSSMRILTGIAIILVVLGHIDFDVLSLGGLFPYYSFHVCIFIFVSGYFYKPENREHVLKYIGRKAVHLLVPYYIWNLIYGIISTILAPYGFIFCNRINLKNFFIEPFLGGHQYGFNFAAWFVPALFVVEVMNILMRKVLSWLKLEKEWLIVSVTLIIGVAVVFLASTGHVWGLYKTPGRFLFMLPIYEMGRTYKVYFEEKEKLIPDVAFIPLCVLCQLVIVFLTGGALNYSVVWCSGFTQLPFIPYITTITGTLFWLRIARLISRCKIGKVISKVGENSFSVMMHHVVVFFVINLCTIGISHVINIEPSFDMVAFHENINYVYMLNNMYVWKLIYAVAGIALPIIVASVLSIFKRKYTSLKNK